LGEGRVLICSTAKLQKRKVIASFLLHDVGYPYCSFSTIGSLFHFSCTSIKKDG